MHRGFGRFACPPAALQIVYEWVIKAGPGGSMFMSILDWTGVIGAIVVPFLLGVMLEHRLYPVERQWAARLGRG
jgi:hypothetical protein